VQQCLANNSKNSWRVSNTEVSLLELAIAKAKCLAVTAKKIDEKAGKRTWMKKINMINKLLPSLMLMGSKYLLTVRKTSGKLLLPQSLRNSRIMKWHGINMSLRIYRMLITVVKRRLQTHFSREPSNISKKWMI
jgi:hypothetical protein